MTKDFERGHLAWINMASPESNDECPDKRVAEESYTQKRRKQHEHRDWRDAATRQGVLAATRNWNRQRSPLSTIMLDLWPPELGENRSVLF